MSALGSMRLLPLLQCQHAALYAGHLRPLSSFLWRPLAKHCSAVKPLQTWNSVQIDVFRSPLSIQSLSRFSTVHNSPKKGDKGNENAAEKAGDVRAKSIVDEEKTEFDFLRDPNISSYKKFTEAWKKYWYVVIPVHTVASIAYFLCFCYLASIGFSPIPLLEKLGWFEEALKTAKESKFAIIAVAIVFQKLAVPLRWLTTLYIIRALAGRGKLMTSSEFMVVVKKYLKGKGIGK